MFNSERGNVAEGNKDTKRQWHKFWFIKYIVGTITFASSILESEQKSLYGNQLLLT